MVAIPPKFTPEVLKEQGEQADYGVLKQLEGTWVNVNPTAAPTLWGVHTTCMPSPGTNSEMIPGKFTFLCQNYTEELTFSLVPGGVRNRAGANEQFCGAVKYDTAIRDLNGNLLHEENGMYLWLDQIYNHPADDESVEQDLGAPELASGAGANGPVYVPDYSVARSGVIPHGSTMQMFGHSSEHKGKPEFPTGKAAWQEPHLSISPSMGGAGATPSTPIDLDAPPPDWVFDTGLPISDPSGNRTYTQRILAHELYPYSVRPDLILRDAIKDQNITGYTMLALDTEEATGAQGGVLNTPIVRRYVPVVRMDMQMWIETVVEDGEEILQLQYAQIVDFEFHFGTDGGVTRWPHIQVNTLRKKA
ncbi:peroxidase, FMP-type [Primorskyibacter sp. 2E233]|uniref:peroxidase, FMP-type n=1 Tax=Primorskyibacter sp. 2E233 TaxID=3413431 RepID=UPI003BEFA634